FQIPRNIKKSVGAFFLFCQQTLSFCRSAPILILVLVAISECGLPGEERALPRYEFSGRHWAHEQAARLPPENEIGVEVEAKDIGIRQIDPGFLSQVAADLGQAFVADLVRSIGRLRGAT